MARTSTFLALGLLLLVAVAVHCEEEDGGEGDVSAPSGSLAGYQPASDVEEHAKIDLDIKAIEDSNNEDPPAYADAFAIYTNGQNSDSDGELRTIQGFSTKYASEASYQTETFAIQANNFWGSWDYADKHLTAAFNGQDLADYGKYATGTLGSTDDARKQIIKKVIKFQAVFQFAVHELEAAVKRYNDESGDAPSRYGTGGSVHALDEWWAFHAGSLESGATNGYGPYILYEKRGKKFGTADCAGFNSGGVSCANKQLFESTNELKVLMQSEGNSAEIEKHTKCIRATLKIGPIQGCLEYGYKSSIATAEELPAWKAEAWAFCGAALPFLYAVDQTAANNVRAQVTLDNDNTPDWSVVKGAFSAANLNKMGVRCADIGAYETAAAAHTVCSDTGDVSNTDGTVDDCPESTGSGSGESAASGLRAASMLVATLSAAVAALFAF